MADVVPLVDGELRGFLGPGVVGEEALDLVVRGDAAGDVPAQAGREHDRADGGRVGSHQALVSTDWCRGVGTSKVK